MPIVGSTSLLSASKCSGCCFLVRFVVKALWDLFGAKANEQTKGERDHRCDYDKMSLHISSIEDEFKERTSSATTRPQTDDVTISIKVPPTQLLQKSRSLSQQNPTPRMTRQQAFDMAGNNGFQHANSCNNPQNLWLSPNNSFESNSTTQSTQKTRHQQWVKQQSSVNSSNYSNGEVKSYATNSRSRRSSEHKTESRHRFSLIPQVFGVVLR